MSAPDGTRGRANGNEVAALALLERLGPAMARGDRSEQVAIASKLIELRAPLGGQWRQLAYLTAHLGELGMSRAAARLFADASGGTAQGRYEHAGVLFDLGMPAEADALLRTVPETIPDATAHAYSRGIMSMYLGRIAEAREHLDQVTAAQPRSGTSWLALASMSDLAADDELAARILAAGPGMADAMPGERASYWYALGKLHADRAEHEAAFHAYARGAEQIKASAPYDAAQDRAEAEEAVRGYDSQSLATLAHLQREPTGRTIFVTGPPRSGTTLVQQILTSHSAVAGGAELARLSLLAREVGGRSYPELARYVEQNGAAEPVRLWHHWLDERFAPEGRAVDKSLDTSRYLGLAAALLPEAPLIWMTRDPLDRAWSCFSTKFLGMALPWSYDLESIAAHFRLEDQLLESWRSTLGSRILVVPYEELVSEPAAWIRRILAHCGLREEPAVFAPHQNAAPVTTASALQVRRPIGRTAIGSSHPYRPFLEPFLAAYYR